VKKAGGKLRKVNPESETEDEDGIRIIRPWVAGGLGCNARMLLRKIHSSHLLQLEVRRPRLWTVTLPRNAGESLGLELKYTDEGGGLVVGRINDEAVQRFNEGQTELAIARNDRILSVDGSDETQAALMQGLHDSGAKVVLRMSRPALNAELDAVRGG